jgi:N utilization substance protein A
MSGQDIIHFIEQIGRDKGIDKEVIIDAIKAAVLSAARKRYGLEDSLEVDMDPNTGNIILVAIKNVVEKVSDPATEIELDKARELDPYAQLNEQVKIPLETEEFGRIAAQTAKQVILQRVREAERKRIYDDYHDRIGELVGGIVLRHEKGNVIVDLGKTEAILPKREQGFRENFKKGEHIRAYLLDVVDSGKGPQVILSRTHTDFLVKLFELEVPEISDKIVEIKTAAREPSGRSKIAVISHDDEVDPVGACVGMRGSRVQAVVQELRGEKIDIIAWSENPTVFVKNALSPAEVKKINVDEENKSMEVIVENDQLSLAIGKKGQNVRLATKLTQWRIDIKGESEPEQEEAAAEEGLEAATAESRENNGEVPAEEEKAVLPALDETEQTVDEPEPEDEGDET